MSRTGRGDRNSLRVLVLSHMYPRARHPAGGIFVHEQVRALRERGIDARVVSGEPFWVQTLNPIRFLRALRAYHMQQPLWDEWDTVPVLQFPYLCGYLFRPSLHAFTYVAGLRRIMGAIETGFPFDVIHAHTSFLDGSAALAMRRASGRPAVITEHTGPFSLLTRNALMKRITRRAVTGADRRIAVSASLKQDMAQGLDVSPASIDVLPNGVDTSVFRPNDDGRRRAADGLVRAIWVGHYVAIKRVDRLLEAFAQAFHLDPRLRLTLLGDGEDRAAMEHLADRLGLAVCVTFVPAGDRAAVAAAMRAHDLLVVSSEKETFSLVALEALACGIPVLTTACGGPEALIAEPSFGLVVSNDVAGVAQGLIAFPTRIASADPRYLHAQVSARYGWPKIAERLAALYQMLVGSSRERAG